jgi:gluconolactonase
VSLATESMTSLPITREPQTVLPQLSRLRFRGNLFVTDSGKWLAENGCLCRFTPDGQGKVIFGPMGLRQWLALSADERFLFMVESNTNSVLRLELDAAGNVLQHGTYATECGWTPDGLALDEQGNLYVSAYASDDIYRVTPAGEKRFSPSTRGRSCFRVPPTWPSTASGCTLPISDARP